MNRAHRVGSALVESHQRKLVDLGDLITALEGAMALVAPRKAHIHRWKARVAESTPDGAIAAAGGIATDGTIQADCTRQA